LSTGTWHQQQSQRQSACTAPLIRAAAAFTRLANDYECSISQAKSACGSSAGDKAQSTFLWRLSSAAGAQRATTTATRQVQSAACPKLLPPAPLSRGTPSIAPCKAQVRLLYAQGQQDERTLGLFPADGAAAAPRYFSARTTLRLAGYLRQRGASVPGANTPAAAAAHAAAR
jgi:hypothetical protein